MSEFSPNLSQSYWEDVNTYTDKILSGVEETTSGLLYLKAYYRTACWRTESYTWATLDKGRVPKSGFLAFLALKDEYYSLDIKGDVGPDGDRENYRITFDPNKEIIEEAAIVPKPPKLIHDNLLLAWKRISAYRQEMARLRGEGHFNPGQDDYERLHSELQRGVNQIEE